MITRRLQAGLDQMLATSPQRLILMALGFASASGTSLLIAAGPGRSGTWLIWMIAFAALLVVVEPDEHLGLTVIALVMLQWLATDPEPTTGRALAVAVGLFSFHAIVALIAVTPHTATVPVVVLATWLLRSVPVVLSTAGVWLLVVVLDGRDLPGSALLSVAAVAALTVGLLVFRDRSAAGRLDGD